MPQPSLAFYVTDVVVLLCAIGAFASLFHEFTRRLVPRFRLLVPGVLATLSTTLLIAYPEPKDLGQLQLWSVVAVCLLLGVARGALIRMYTDHNWSVVRVRRTFDGLFVGGMHLLFAGVQFTVEMAAGSENPLEVTFEFLMVVTGSFLLGRSAAAWVRARTIPHDDLRNTG